MKDRRRKNNKYAHLQEPELSFDFHGRGRLYPEDIIEMLEEFLVDATKKKATRLLIITGKGLHSSEGGPVVKPTIISHLKTHQKVKNFKESRRDRGGSGALEVELY